MTAAASAAGVSRQTASKWVGRFRSGMLGLAWMFGLALSTVYLMLKR